MSGPALSMKYINASYTHMTNEDSFSSQYDVRSLFWEDLLDSFLKHPDERSFSGIIKWPDRRKELNSLKEKYLRLLLSYRKRLAPFLR